MLTIHKWLRTDMGGNDGDISSEEGAIAVTRAGNWLVTAEVYFQCH